LPICPECGSERLWKDGLRRIMLSINDNNDVNDYVQHISPKVQRYLCRACGYRFSSSELKYKKNLSVTDNRQVCDAEAEGSKNLVTVETQETGQREATTADVKGKIVEFLWHLKKEGYAEDTIKTYVRTLELLQKRGADLTNAESVKMIIAQQVELKRWGDGRRSNAIKAYTAFLQMLGSDWKKPKYKFKKGLPRPPTTEQVKQLIAAASKKYAPIFRFMAETGASPIETSILSERSFDFARNTVYIEGRKGHLDRILPLSPELSGLMKEFLTKYGKFPPGDSVGRKWRKYRNMLAKKLNDVTLKNVRLYDLRHYFGTMLYAQTRDPLYVKDKMGHTKLETTMIYTKLIIYPVDEEYICRVAETLEEAQDLIEAGFEKHDEFNGVHLYRKRKSLVEGPWSSQKGPGSCEKGPWSSLDTATHGDISRKPISSSFSVSPESAKIIEISVRSNLRAYYLFFQSGLILTINKSELLEEKK